MLCGRGYVEMLDVKFLRTLIAAATLAPLCCAPVAFSAEPAKKPRKRADVPWVSLEHQRALEAERLGLAKKAEETVPVVKKSDGKPKLSNMITAPEISADKFEHVQNSEGDLIATGNAKIEDEKFELHADKIRYYRPIARCRRKIFVQPVKGTAAYPARALRLVAHVC